MANQTIAFFDVDNTIVRGRCAVTYAFYLYKKKAINITHILKFFHELLKAAILLPFGLYNKDKGAKRCLKELKKFTYKQLNDLAKECFEEKIKPKLIKGTLDLIKEHQQKGHKIVLVTATPTLIANYIGKYVGANLVIGTKFLHKNNQFIGIEKPYCYGQGKIANIQKKRLKLKGSYAYTDNTSDIPLLQKVKYPNAINPERKLKKIAEKNGWKGYNF